MRAVQDPSGLQSNALMYADAQIFSMDYVEGDKKINLYSLGHPVHSWYAWAWSSATAECGPLLRNSTMVNVSGDDIYSDFVQFSIGMPFDGAHFKKFTTDSLDEFVCRTSYLALALTKEKNWRGQSQHPDAFIMQAYADVPARSCGHEIALHDGRKLTRWNPVALLAGWREGTSSLGTVVAISPNGTKVAAATWSRVLMWSLHPKLLHQGERHHYFPIRDYNGQKGFGRLRPTLLSVQGVVHKMLWADETHLYATTDQGLVKWDMEPASNCKRQHWRLTC